jgi:hypothetical protein
MISEERKKIIKSFQFRTNEGEDLYKSVLVVCDLALQIEMSKVMSANTVGEARIHSAGRLDAINDMLLEIQRLREEARADQS